MEDEVFFFGGGAVKAAAAAEECERSLRFYTLEIQLTYEYIESSILCFLC